MHRSLIAVALLLLTTQVNAQVYKWTDSSGTTHYSEAPPAHGVKFSTVTTTGTVEPPSKPAPEAAAAPAAEPAAAPKPVADTPENRSKLCSSLKANLATLHGSAAVVMQQGGKTVALDSDQRKQQTDMAQAQYNQYCLAQ
jgi:hypothetical protein